MWHVDELKGNEIIISPSVEFYENECGLGLPQGSNDESKNGYAFYQAVEEKKEGSETKITYHYITFSFGKPLLKAVTEKQFKVWKGWKIIAKPAKICWQEDK